MSRPKTHLAYTEINARPRNIAMPSKAGVSSQASKQVQDHLDDVNQKAKSDRGRFYLENATGTQF